MNIVLMVLVPFKKNLSTNLRNFFTLLYYNTPIGKAQSLFLKKYSITFYTYIKNTFLLFFKEVRVGKLKAKALRVERHNERGKLSVLAPVVGPEVV